MVRPSLGAREYVEDDIYRGYAVKWNLGILKSEEKLQGGG